MVTLHDNAAAVQRIPAALIALATDPAAPSPDLWRLREADEPEGPTWEDELWLAGFHAHEHGGDRRAPKGLIGAWRKAWLGGWDQAREEEDRGIFLEGFEAGERFAALACPDSLNRRQSRQWHRGYLAGRAAIQAEAIAELADAAADREAIGAEEVDWHLF